MDFSHNVAFQHADLSKDIKEMEGFAIGEVEIVKATA